MAKKLAVQFKGISWGKQSASIGVNLSRTEMDIAEADKMLVNRTIACKIACDPNDGRDVDGQSKLNLGSKGHSIDAEFSAEVTGFTVRNNYFVVNLKVPMTDVQDDGLGASHMVRFCGKPGTLTLGRSRQLKKEEQAEEPEGD